MTTSPHPRRRQRHIETEEYVAMLHRMINALERRLSDDPAGLVHVEPLRARLQAAANVAIAESQERVNGYSFGELAAILNMSRPSVHERAGKGRRLLAERRAKLGVVTLRDHRAAKLTEAGVDDRRAVTG